MDADLKETVSIVHGKLSLSLSACMFGGSRGSTSSFGGMSEVGAVFETCAVSVGSTEVLAARLVARNGVGPGRSSPLSRPP